MPDVGRKAPTGKTHTQSMRFDNEKWSKADSREWVKEHDGFTDGYEETENEHRWRQYDPDDDKFRYRRFDDDLPAGVYFIVGYPKTKSNKGNNMNRIELRGVIVDSAFDVDWMQDFIKKGLFTPESAFRRALGEAKTDEALTVYVNSPGGSVFAGNEIINAVRDWKTETGQNVEVIVGALAASMASVFTITTATTVKAHKNSLMMFHGVTTCMCGGAEALHDEAELCAKMNSDIKKSLLDKYSMDPATVTEWFAEGRMGWLNAEEMLEAMIVQEIIADDADVILFEDSAIKTAKDKGLDIAAVLNLKPEGKAATEPPSPAPAPQDKGTLDYQRGLVDGAAVGRSEVTAEYADKVADLNKKLQDSETLASKVQGEKDRTRTELDTLRTETEKTTTDLREQLNQTTARLHKAVGGALKFSTTPDTWEAALAEHKGDYAKAKAQYPELLDKFKQAKGGFVTVKNLLAFLGISAALVVALAATAGSLFTDVTSHYPADIVRQVNAMGDALEDSIDGTTPMVSPVVQGTLTGISTNGGTTNILITTDGELDASKVADADLGDMSAASGVWSVDAGALDNANIAADAGIELTKLETVEPGYLIVGNATSQAVDVVVSGDIGMANDGTASIAAGVIVNADVSAAAGIVLTKLETVEPGYLIVGNATSQAVDVVVSGDIGMANDGTASIAAGVIVNADVSAAAGIVLTKLETVEPGYLIVGNATSQAVDVVVSGDIGMANDGTASIAAGVVVNADVSAAAGIVLTKLETVEPGYLIVGNATSQAVDVVVSGVIGMANDGTTTFIGVERYAPSQVSVTNGQVLTITASSYVINGIGSTNNATNTITLAAPTEGGMRVTFMGAFGTSNLLTFPSSGASRVPSGLLLDEDDTCSFESLDNSTWLCTSFIDNQ